MSFPAYPEYKDSEVPWLGAVPRVWEVAALKRVVGLVTDKADERTFPVALENIEGWTGVYLETGSDFAGDGVAFEKGDVLYGKLRPYLAKTLVAWRSGEAIGDFHVQRPHSIQPTYLGYLLRCKEHVSLIDGSTYGSKMPRASWDFLGSQMICLPSPEEQEAIAAFLNRETAKIDALVAEQERLIALLKEKQQAVISHAVTKGLDPDAPMKESGIEWLGEIPAHWTVSAVKRMCVKITDGAHISPETENGVHPFVSTKDLDGSKIDFEGCLLTSEGNFAYLVKTGCKPEGGDVLFSKDGTVGRTAVVQDYPDFVVASSLIIIRPDKCVLDPIFLDFLCQSFVVQNQVESYVKGAGLPRLSIKNLLRTFGAFPPIVEQRSIARSLSTRLETFDDIQERATEAIGLLKERRAALISAAVTGKIDVRGLVEQHEMEAA